MKHIENYLKNVAETKSAWTVSTKAAAICKMHKISIDDLEIELPKRKRQDIVRSRKAVKYEKHISDETEEFFASFTRCTGLRIREMKAVQGTDLVEKDGIFYVHVANGKGGKTRDAQVIGSDSEIEKKLEQKPVMKTSPVGEQLKRQVEKYGMSKVCIKYRICERTVYRRIKNESNKLKRS